MYSFYYGIVEFKERYHKRISRTEKKHLLVNPVFLVCLNIFNQFDYDKTYFSL